MKITKLVIRSLSGHFESDGEFWEERLVRPIDIYPEYANEKHENWSLQKNNNVSTNSIFVEIEEESRLTDCFSQPNNNKTIIIVDLMYDDIR